MFFSLNHLCQMMGVSFSSQLHHLKRRMVKEPHQYPQGCLERFAVRTPGGEQTLQFLRKSEAAWWVTHLPPDDIRAELREYQEDVAAELKHIAERRVFGDMSDLDEEDRSLALAQRDHGVFYWHCRRCGAPIR